MTAAEGTAVFAGGLGVVRAQIAPDVFLPALPQPRRLAVDQAEDLMRAIVSIGDAADFVAFDMGDGLDACWVRARDVITVDVVPTEDPSS